MVDLVLGIGTKYLLLLIFEPIVIFPQTKCKLRLAQCSVQLSKLTFSHFTRTIKIIHVISTRPIS